MTCRSTSADVEQIVRESRASIEPGVVEHDRILSTFAGVRVLPQGDGETPSARRETVFERGDGGMLSIAGGKFTTFRRIAFDALERLRGDLGLRGRDRPPVPLPGAAAPEDVAERLLGDHPALLGASARTSRASTGARPSTCSPARARIRGCSSRSRPALPEVAAQVRWARGQEWALTADDVLARRTTLARSAVGTRPARGWRSCCDERALRRRARPGHASSRCMLFDAARRTVAGAQQEHRQIRRARGGSSTTPTRSSRRSRAASTRRSQRPEPRRPTWPRSASPTSARPSCCGSARAAGRSRTRSCGRTRAAPSGVAALGRPRPLPRADGPAARDVLLGPEALVAARRRCRARARGPRRASWRRARSTAGSPGTSAGVHVTDATNASRTLLMDLAHARLGRRPARRDRRPARAAGRDRAVERRRRRDRRRAAGRAARRPAGGALRAVLLRAGRGQVHVRHRQLPGAQHRRARRGLEPRADHRRRLPAWARGRPRTCSRARSRSRARSCSGCATTSG